MAAHLVRCTTLDCPTCLFLKRGPSIDSAGGVTTTEDYVRHSRTDLGRSGRKVEIETAPTAYHDHSPVELEHHRAVVPIGDQRSVVPIKLADRTLSEPRRAYVVQSALDEMISDNARLLSRNAELEKRAAHLEASQHTKDKQIAALEYQLKESRECQSPPHMISKISTGSPII